MLYKRLANVLWQNLAQCTACQCTACQCTHATQHARINAKVDHHAIRQCHQYGTQEGTVISSAKSVSVGMHT